MSTTTIRLSDELKTRVARAAERAGTSAHNFILEAIAEKTEQTERRADFFEVAEARYDELAKTGKTISWEKMRTYLGARSEGKTVSRPAARKLAR
jgi:predicted transcriptional regulator